MRTRVKVCCIQSVAEERLAVAMGAEAEHRAILEQALVQTRRRSLAEVLASMPDVGCDEDFERVEEHGGDAPRVFG